RNEAPVNRNAVASRGHAVLADAPVDVAAGEVFRGDFRGRGDLGVVGGGQVRGTRHELGHGGRDHVQRRFARLAGRYFGRVFRELALVGVDHTVEVFVKIAADAPLELGPLLRLEPREPRSPGVVLRLAARANPPPGGKNVVRYDERVIRPIEIFARARDFGRARRLAMRLVGPGSGRQTEADRRLAGDHRRPVGVL